jgi:hypothetical protein
MLEDVMTADFGDGFGPINGIEQLGPDEFGDGRVKEFKATLVVVPIHIFVAFQQVSASPHVKAYPVWDREVIREVTMKPGPA